MAGGVGVLGVCSSNSWVSAIINVVHRAPCTIDLWRNADGAHERVVRDIYCTTARSFARPRLVNWHAHGVARHVRWCIRLGAHRIVNFGSGSADYFGRGNCRYRCAEPSRITDEC